MSQKEKLTGRMVAVLLITAGLVLGVTWNKVCIGDNLFEALGLPVWSNGSSGTHYPAVAGIITVLIGSGLFNYTLQAKARRWLWAIAVLLLIVFSLIFIT